MLTGHNQFIIKFLQNQNKTRVEKVKDNTIDAQKTKTLTNIPVKCYKAGIYPPTGFPT